MVFVRKRRYVVIQQRKRMDLILIEHADDTAHHYLELWKGKSRIRYMNNRAGDYPLFE